MAGRPEHVTLTITGGAACDALLSGTITTVRRCWCTVLLLITTHGRVLLISDPAVGSRFAHQMSPRRGIFPWFWHCIDKKVEILFDSSHVSIYHPTSTIRLVPQWRSHECERGTQECVRHISSLVGIAWPHLQHCQECLLRNLHTPHAFHPLLAFF